MKKHRHLMQHRPLPPSHRAAALLLALAPATGLLHASTILTFATTNGTGVSGTSGGPILAANPNASKMLALGPSPYTETPSYGSNVTASSANNGAYLVVGAATPDIALNWTSSGTPPGSNIIEGIAKNTTGWGSDPSNLSNNGVGQINALGAGSSFSVTFTPAAGKGVLIESIDFYKSNLNIAANQGRGYVITVRGDTTDFTGRFAISNGQEAMITYNFGGGIVGRPGEAITLTILRPAAAVEAGILTEKLGAAFIVHTTTNNQNGIDNLRFSEVPAATYTLDTDGDGLLDIDESYTHRTDPQRADSDGDGIPDNVELNTLFTNPLVSDAKLVNYLAARAGKAGPLVFRDSFAKSVKLRLKLNGSPALNDWSPIPLNGAGVTGDVTTAPLLIGLPDPGAPKYFYQLGTTTP